MPSHPFLPFRKNPTPPAFPAWVIDELNLIKLPEVTFIQTHSTYIKPFIEASGLTQEELCERMQSSGRKTTITPELLQNTLTSNDPEIWIISSIFKALDVSWDGFLKFEEEYNERISKSLRTLSDANDRIKNYRQYGPCLYALQTVESWMTTAGIAAPYHFVRQVKFAGQSEFHPPVAEQITALIAHKPEDCIHSVAREFYSIGGFLYHRLPNELYLYDQQGHILASGGVELVIPNHLWLTKGRHHRITIKKKKPPLIPPNQNKRNS